MKKIFKKTVFFLLMSSITMLYGCSKGQSELFLTTRDNDLAEVQQSDMEISENGLTLAQQNKTGPEDTVFVYICGEVLKPGVYEMPVGSRIYEVINLAGGLTGEADPDYLNQVEMVEDGQKIKVPILQEYPLQDENQEIQGKGGRVNINTATEEVLTTLTGIGSSRAKDIISYRDNNGGFKSIEEIKNVSGIKDGLYNKIKDGITVD